MASRKPKWTQYQHAARRRNWCIYVMRGMTGLLVVFERFGVRPANINRVRSALDSLAWDIDVAYHEHVERINRGEYIAKRDPTNVVQFRQKEARRKAG